MNPMLYVSIESDGSVVKRLFVEGDKAGTAIICMNKLSSSGIKTLYGIKNPYRGREF
jgi:hypothetical protein